MAEVQRLRLKSRETYGKKNATKRLAAINRLIFSVIPADPTLPDYRQGKTLGDGHQHWYRAKFYQQYRLFFRYDTAAKVIIYAWVNDDRTLRAYDSKDDAYRTFAKMLAKDRPPDDWPTLLKEATRSGAKDRFDRLQNDGGG